MIIEYYIFSQFKEMSLDKSNQIYLLDTFFYPDTNPGTTCSYKNITSMSDIVSSDFIFKLSQLYRNHVYSLYKRTLTGNPDFEANILQKPVQKASWQCFFTFLLQYFQF